MGGGSAEADAIIERLRLEPHPEGGWYRETYRDERTCDGRAASTAIYYLLRQGEVSAWHRIDVAELWHHYAGAPLRLRISVDGARIESHRLGTDLAAGEEPQSLVPAGVWQTAAPLGPWSLVGCTVAPGFSFSGFEMAPAGFAAQAENDPEP